MNSQNDFKNCNSNFTKSNIDLEVLDSIDRNYKSIKNNINDINFIPLKPYDTSISSISNKDSKINDNFIDK